MCFIKQIKDKIKALFSFLSNEVKRASSMQHEADLYRLNSRESKRK